MTSAADPCTSLLDRDLPARLQETLHSLAYLRKTKINYRRAGDSDTALLCNSAERAEPQGNEIPVQKKTRDLFTTAVGRAVPHVSDNGNHKHYRASSRLSSASKWLMYNKRHCFSWAKVWVFVLSTDYAASLFELHLINACLMRSSGHMAHGCSPRDMSNKIIRSRRARNLAFIFTWQNGKLSLIHLVSDEILNW